MEMTMSKMRTMNTAFSARDADRSLFAFNVGVELAQLAFIGAC